MTQAPVDPVDLTARLIRCPSVTPEEGGALVLLEKLLTAAGFDLHRVDRGGDRQPLRPLGRARREPQLRLQRPYRRGAGRRCRSLDA